MSNGKWGAWLEHATCGNDQCRIHKFKQADLQSKYYNFAIERIISTNYQPEELQTLRRVANAMG